MKYINAEKLIAEIERQQRNLTLLANTEQVSVRRDCAVQNGAYSYVLSIIDSLRQEQPEVDFEKFDKDVTEIWGRCAAEPNDSIACIHIETFNEVARHFYELGFNARKEGQK